MSATENEVIQDEFNAKYITAKEIAETVGVSRAAVSTAITTERLPKPFYVGTSTVQLWERDKIQPHLDSWKQSLEGKTE